METTYKTLAKFLASLNLTERRLKEITGISIPRLRAIYKRGNFTDDEFMRLIKVLSIRQAVNLTYACQIGDFNQHGIGNSQTFITNIINVVMRRLGISPDVTKPQVLPAKPVLALAVQQRALSQQPSGKATLVSGVLAPIALVR
jgi:hypothetical protein